MTIDPTELVEHVVDQLEGAVLDQAHHARSPGRGLLCVLGIRDWQEVVLSGSSQKQVRDELRAA
jgi:hypothetical protein